MKHRILEQTDLLLRDLKFNIAKIFEKERHNISQMARQLIALFSEKIAKYKFTLTNIFEKMLSGLNKVFFGFKALEQKLARLFYKYQSYTQQQLHVLNVLEQKSLNILKDKYNKINRQIAINKTALASLDPKSVLKRGYSIVYDENNKVIKDSAKVKLNQAIFTKLYKGEIISKIKKIKK